ncbi:MAG: hypothetical protein OXG05_00650 [Gammaproteobacteria bacterium]|nr:hypothetical protein [Gammaproteobacteria bacterium]
MNLRFQAFPALRRTSHILRLGSVLSLMCVQTFADSSIPLLDDRCEVTKAYVSFERASFRRCAVEVNECIAERMSRFSETEDQAEEHCWLRPLDVNPDFEGPCPEHMEELESQANADRESLMQLIVLRNYFERRNERVFKHDIFKREESLQSIRNILADVANDPVALSIYHLTLFATNDLVERHSVDLTIRGLEPNCPHSRNLFLFGIDQATDQIVENWLSGQGSGSELTTSEMSDLLSRTQHTILQAYDLAIEDSDHSSKLHWALGSIDNAVLSRKFENLQLIERYIDVGLENFVDNRRATLIRKFSNEYDVDSNHGRAQALSTMCSSHALDLGLVDHCAKLLNHFGLSDANQRDSPAPDWGRAAISLMVGLTRDCSDHSNWLLHGPYWWNVRPCIANHRLLLASNLRELLDGFSEDSKSAEREALEAFLQLDDTSDERFLRALAIDNSMVVYASRLGKRLHRLGDIETASNVLSGVDDEMKSELPRSEKDLLDNSLKAVKERKYQNWTESSWDL